MMTTKVQRKRPAVTKRAYRIKKHLAIGLSMILVSGLVGSGIGYWFGMRQMDVLYATIKPYAGVKPLPSINLGITPEGVAYTESLAVDLTAIAEHLQVFERLVAAGTEPDKLYDYWMSQIESQRPVILRAGPSNPTYVRYQELRLKYPEWFTPATEEQDTPINPNDLDGMPKVTVPATPDGINF